MYRDLSHSFNEDPRRHKGDYQRPDSFQERVQSDYREERCGNQRVRIQRVQIVKRGDI